MSQPCQKLKSKLTDILSDLVSMSADVIKKSGLHLTEAEALDLISADRVTSDVRILLQRVQNNLEAFTKAFEKAVGDYKEATTPKKRLNLSLRRNGTTEDTDVDLTNSDGESDFSSTSVKKSNSQPLLVPSRAQEFLAESLDVKGEDTASESESEKSVQNFDVPLTNGLPQDEDKTDGFIKALDELDKVEKIKELERRAESMSFDFDEFNDDCEDLNSVPKVEDGNEQMQKNNHELLDLLNKAMPDSLASEPVTEEEVDEALRILEDDVSLRSVALSDLSSVDSSSVSADSDDEWMPSEDEEELSNKESEANEESEGNEESEEQFELKSVQIDLKKRVDEMDEAEIDRLCNIHNINKRKCTKTLRKHKKVKRKRIRVLSSSSSSSSSIDLSDISDISASSMTPDLVIDTQRPLSPPDVGLGDVTALADELLEKLDKEDEEQSDASSEPDEEPEKEKKKEEKKDANEEKEKGDNVPKPAKKVGSWRNDVTLWTSSEESEDEPMLLIDEKEDIEDRILGEIKEDIKMKKMDDETLIITDSGSDDDDDDVTFVDEIPSVLSDGRGRRNIRAILDDDELNELTQKAKSEEDARIIRLEEHSRTMEKVQSQRHDLILDVDVKTGNPLIAVDYDLSNMLKPHQQEGVKFMWEACYESVDMLKTKSGTGCILAHCMGLGKTLQVITLIHTLFKYEVTKTKHVLIIAPLSTVNNWKNEFKQTFKRLSQKENFRPFFIVKSDVFQKMGTVISWRQNGGVLVLGYETFQILTNDKMVNRVEKQQIDKLYEALIDPGPDLIVCDEGHQLKNDKTLRTKALMKVKTKRRIVLTGTPLQNNLKEYYYMVQFVKPHLLGTYTEFTNRFATPIKNGQFHDSRPEDIKLMKKRTHVLTKLLKKTIHRVEASVLSRYLPEITDYTIFVKLTPLQVKLYETYIQEVTSRATELGRGFLHDVMILNFSNFHPYTLQLHYSKPKRKSKKKNNDGTVNPIEFVECGNTVTQDWYKNFLPDDVSITAKYSVKVSLILDIIDEATKIGDKVLIFAQNLVELDTLEHFLKTCGTENLKFWQPNVDYYRMDGETPVENRDILCKRFNTQPEIKVFLLTHKVGGLGLNLTGANRVIMIGSNHNPTLDTQSMYRVYRFGQKKKCYVYRLLSLATMEEKIYHRCVVKLILSGTVVDKLHFDRRYSASDLQEMYKVDFSEYFSERPIPVVPTDKMLAQLLQTVPDIYKYHPHNSLLENRPEEELTDEDKKLAWDEFNSINEAAKNAPVINPARLPIHTLNPDHMYNKFGHTTGTNGPNLVLNPLNNIGRGFIPPTVTRPNILPNDVRRTYVNQVQRRFNLLANRPEASGNDSGVNQGLQGDASMATIRLQNFANALRERAQRNSTSEAPSGEFNYALNKVV